MDIEKLTKDVDEVMVKLFSVGDATIAAVNLLGKLKHDNIALQAQVDRKCFWPAWNDPSGGLTSCDDIPSNEHSKYCQSCGGEIIEAPELEK